MHILLTNDDGITAPGIFALSAALREIGELTVLAPDRNWSASGHVKTLHRPLRVWETDFSDGSPAYATDGAPSDCVALAVLGFFKKPIDLVVSGINPLANVGHDVTYSGTVTAAMEAAISGLPGIAVSLDSGRQHPSAPDYESAAWVASKLIQQVSDQNLPPKILLNINIPNRPSSEINGVSITRQGQRVYRDALDVREDPRGRKYYWIGGDTPTGIPEPGTDIWALSEGQVSITPLKMDLTAHDYTPAMDGWDLQI
jgi:5'-nucleotidase